MSVLAELAGHVIGPHGGRRVRVAVDGVDASGKTTFADALADLVRPFRPVVRATVDRFSRPRSERLWRPRPATPCCWSTGSSCSARSCGTPGTSSSC